MSKLEFDRARFDAGEMPTRTRIGRRVLKVVDSGLSQMRYPIAAWIEGGADLCSYTRDGWFYADSSGDAMDLVHEPKMRKVTVVLLRSATDLSRVVALTDDQEDDFATLLRRFTVEGRLISVTEHEVPA